ncbi:MOSC domain-containing protein [Aliiroseovarius subalbicans]|uniref:MOSC domain-containing protein n=1 Tax=Aliiroseovarius subalbicans TaxID=2925840 RepID=UPI001F5A8605|nr:MOSC domain-containing protein [Aliiroseovarius subalbicans]MCI2401109.1 MOSC domain-containing protein [Aliiroseovarius subalbicans]
MNGHVAEIWRHPIKSHGREELARILLTEARTIPWDRRWAVAHELAKVDFDAPEWAPCSNFSRGAKAPKLQAIEARCNLPSGKVTFTHPDLKELTINPDDPGDAGLFIQWVMPISPPERALPARLVRVTKRGMTDTDYPSISIINRASHAEVAQRLGKDISINRWRGNLVLDGLDPWVERDWIGRKIRVGLAELEVRENITRCRATTASTRTGERDADTLGALNGGWGHQEFGAYAVVTKTGDLRQGDTIEVLS